MSADDPHDEVSVKAPTPSAAVEHLIEQQRKRSRFGDAVEALRKAHEREANPPRVPTEAEREAAHRKRVAGLVAVQEAVDAARRARGLIPNARPKLRLVRDIAKHALKKAAERLARFHGYDRPQGAG